MVIAVSIISILLILILLFAYYTYRIIFYSPYPKIQSTVDSPDGVIQKDDTEGTKKRIRDLYARAHEDVYIRSYDGLRLRARVFEGEPGKPVTICFHGYRGSALRDNSGGATIVLNQGHTVIIPDERAHMQSAGHTITYGIRERYDVREWVKFAVDRYGDNVRINLMGISMGAATVLMSLSTSLPENVRTVSADCPYNSPSEIIKFVMRRDKYPLALVYPAAYLGALIYAHINLNAITAADAVRDANVPIIIMHGTDDHLVPDRMSEEIRAANPEMIERHTFEGAAHGLSFIVDEKRYTETYLRFLSKHDML